MRDDIYLRWIVTIVLLVLSKFCSDVEQDHTSVVIHVFCAIDYVASPIENPRFRFVTVPSFRECLVWSNAPEISSQ